MSNYRKSTHLLKRPSRGWLVLSVALLLAGLAFLGAFGYSWYQYAKSSWYYAGLQQLAVAATGQNEAPAENGVDFASLQAINTDTAAWLVMPGIDISLPVVQATDNETYLHKGFDGSDSPEGCLFFGASGQEGDIYRVIYGHNLHTGSMFSGLLNYRDGEFYLQNPTFTLYTPDETQTYRIFSCHTATDMEDLYDTNRTAGEEYDAFLQRLSTISEYNTGVEVPSGAQVLTLSTCLTSYGSGLERYVVHAYRES